MLQDSNPDALSHKITHFCQLKLAAHFELRDLERLETFLLGLIARRTLPPTRGKTYDWGMIAERSKAQREYLVKNRQAVRPALDAIVRTLPAAPAEEIVKPEPDLSKSRRSLGRQSKSSVGVIQHRSLTP